MTIEAYILAAADDLDATLNQVRRAIRDDDGTDEFTSYQPRLGRSLWKGDDVIVRALALVGCLLGWPLHLLAQTADPVPAPASEAPAPSAQQGLSAKAIAQFVAGGAIGLALHEAVTW